MSKLLDQLTISKKLSILFFFALFLLAVPNYIYLTEIENQIDFANQEKKGAKIIPEVMNVLQKVQQHRGLSAIILSGDQTVHSSWQKKRTEVDQAFLQLELLLAQYPELDLLPESKKIKTKWNTLKPRLNQVDTSESFLLHTEIAEDILEFIVLVADHSGITYDPTVDGYQIGFVVVHLIPWLTEYSGRIRAVGGKILASGEASIADKTTLQFYTKIGYHELEDIQRADGKISEANPEVGEEISKKMSMVISSTDAVLKIIDREILNSTEYTYSTDKYFSEITNAINGQYQFMHEASEIQETILDQITFEKRRDMILFLLFEGIFLFAAIIIGYIIVTKITGPAKLVSESLYEVSQGNLKINLKKTEGRDEIAVMQNSLQETVNHLSQVLSEIIGSAFSLTGAADQLSSTAQTMSQASSEQSASVEEVSSSLETMSTSIQQNTENSRETNKIAMDAAKQAFEGGKAVKETVNAMNQIAEKISIIDVIAYQTNLLALNAAIEAARAGEQGKGFAVVAAEVRKLAERSQSAAQEIGEIASNSVQLANDAGKLLDEMVPSIKKTSDLVQEVAVASEDQSSRVSQVNQAMVQLDQITQQNASSAEELAATAEETNTQADQLNKLVSYFKIDQSYSLESQN